MRIVIEIEDQEVVEAGTIIIANVNYNMFEKDVGSGIVLTPGFKTRDSKTPWMCVVVEQPEQEKAAPKKAHNIIPMRIKKGKK